MAVLFGRFSGFTGENWENHFREVGWDGMDWIDLAQGMHQSILLV
jgi:hypothetical protein